MTKMASGAVLALTMTLGATAHAQGVAKPYATMAPLDQYLMDRAAEAALAKSAAPPSISDNATILVLTAKGYETVAKGKNGFTCLVERSWMSPFDFPEFWNPKMRGPICYNPPAVRSVLPGTIKRTDLVLKGLTKPALLAAIKTEVAKTRLGMPELGSMSYMLSPHQYLNDKGQAWAPHMMFYAGRSDAAAWGANLPGSPIMLDDDHTLTPEPQSTFMMMASAWSDGTPYVKGQGHGH